MGATGYAESGALDRGTGFNDVVRRSSSGKRQIRGQLAHSPCQTIPDRVTGQRRSGRRRHFGRRPFTFQIVQPAKSASGRDFLKISFHSFHQDRCHCRNFCLIVLLDRQFLWKTPPQGDCGLENSRIQVNFHRVELALKVHSSVRILKHFKMVKVMKVNEITDHFLCPLSLADLLDRRRNEGGNGQLALDSNGQGSHAQEIRIRLLAADSRLSWSQPIAHHGRHRLRYIQRPGKRSDSSSWNLIGCGCVMVQDSIVSIGGRMYLRRR